MNYVLTKTMLDNSESVSFDRIDYHDGFGRLVETVQKAVSPTNKDIVTLQEYDFAGRITTIRQPVSIAGSGEYVPAAQINTAAQTFYNDYAAYRSIIYELSPLNRIENQIGPGGAWHSALDKGEKTAWFTNASSGDYSCALYVVASTISLQKKGMPLAVVTSTTSLRKKGVYAAGELFVTRNTDDDMNVSYVFSDKQGRTLLQREMNGNEQSDTYFVYDDLGNLCYVLPPPAADALGATATWDDTNATLKNYAYIYKYDGRNRCIQKKLPGCEPIVMKYDKADRLIFSQDGNQAGNRWTFFFYDVFGRQTVAGIWKSDTLPALDNLVVKTDYTGTGTLAGYAVNLYPLPALDNLVVKTDYTGTGTVVGYAVNLSPLPAMDLLTVNYHDNHAFLDVSMSAQKDSLVFLNKGYDAQYPNAKGLLAGGRTYQLDDPSKYTVSATYYDQRGRVVQHHASNHLGGYDNEYFKYKFSGKTAQRMIIHSIPGTTKTETYYYNYGAPSTNPGERLLDVKHKISPNTAQTTLAVLTYDETGRLLTKTRAGELSTYHYNVRNWLTRITGTKFNQTLTYNIAVNGV
ncbi:MAG: DUF6443 domain-containing protein, partial [Dysgonamonadaceae bacterium]|nr:DUF6443 domain-containing protein [Dysgonamonadaceae bacterium]